MTSFCARAWAFFTAISSVLLIWAPARADSGPNVVASIPPIHSLVAGVMMDVGSPHLLISGGKSPHTFSLRPSDARRLNQADLVFWAGKGVEGFLVKTLESMDGKARVIELASVPGVNLLPAREGGVWDRHVHGHETHAHDEDDRRKEDDPDADHTGHDQHADHPEHGERVHEDHEFDSHVWLSPENAKAIVAAIVSALKEADPARSMQYQKNGQVLAKRIDTLKLELADKLHPVSDKGFIVFHDAYQYFERDFGLNAVGSMSISPDRPAGARRLSELRDKIKRLQAFCVFVEPQFAPKLAEAIVAGTQARLGALDPVGAGLAPGPELYFELIRGNADALVSCLTQ